MRCSEVIVVVAAAACSVWRVRGCAVYGMLNLGSRGGGSRDLRAFAVCWDDDGLVGICITCVSAFGLLYGCESNFGVVKKRLYA